MSTLRIVLGDQLSISLPLLGDLEPGDRVLMMEVQDEATYVPHHPKKLVLVLSAMRHFAAELAERGILVDYIELDDPRSRSSFTDTIAAYLAERHVVAIRVTAPSERRVLREFQALGAAVDRPVTIDPDPRCIVSPADFGEWADGRKTLVMETFYRDVRRKTGLLMDGDKPAGGKWNFDKANRKRAGDNVVYPAPFATPPDAITRDVIDLVAQRFPDHFGDLEPFTFAVTAAEAQAAADYFLDFVLPGFGDYQDAMRADQAFLFHSLLAPYINIGLLDPLDLCRAVEQRYRDGAVAINAAEGFVRQIIGWREFIRGVYWLQGSGYGERNHLAATAPLPPVYWGGPTSMACVGTTVAQTRENAYSHHIQRLMVTGNLALLLGIDPAEVHRWYLAVYADAFEWVEMPNTIGMALYADGGVVATKPYAASGAYINKMSNYCAGCRYDVRQKQGPGACPFNYLYWDFLMRNEAKLAANHRMGLVYAQLRKMDATRKIAIADDAARFRAAIQSGDGDQV